MSTSTTAVRSPTDVCSRRRTEPAGPVRLFVSAVGWPGRSDGDEARRSSFGGFLVGSGVGIAGRARRAVGVAERSGPEVLWSVLPFIVTGRGTAHLLARSLNARAMGEHERQGRTLVAVKHDLNHACRYATI